jgi:hypothetical protein
MAGLFRGCRVFIRVSPLDGARRGSETSSGLRRLLWQPDGLGSPAHLVQRASEAETASIAVAGHAAGVRAAPIFAGGSGRRGRASGTSERRTSGELGAASADLVEDEAQERKALRLLALVLALQLGRDRSHTPNLGSAGAALLRPRAVPASHPSCARCAKRLESSARNLSRPKPYVVPATIGKKKRRRFPDHSFGEDSTCLRSTTCLNRLTV